MSQTVEWLVIVEECITLLKEEKVKPAISLLETLVEKHKPENDDKPKKRAKSSLTSPRREPSAKTKAARKKSGSHETSKTKSNDEAKEKTDSSSTKTKKKASDRRSSLAKSERVPLQDFVVDETRKSVLRSTKQEKGWEYIVKELYTTERDYIRDLHTLIEVFRDPMLEQKLITPDESMKLFSNVSMILTVNEELLKQLESIDSANTNFSDIVKNPAKRPKNSTKEDMKAMGGVMEVTIREEEGTTTKKVMVDGLTTFQEAIDRVKRKLAQDTANSYQLYHSVDKNLRLIEDFSQGVMEYVEFNKNRLTFVLKRDALKNVQTVGGALLNMAHYLKMYSEYCSNQMQAVETLNRLKKEREGFDAFLKAALKNKRCRRLDLNSFLVIPLQRVCKYPLLIRELLSQTPEGHSDYQPLRTASQLIGESVISINEKKRQNEEQKLMIDLQSCIDGLKKGDTIISPARRFLEKGKVTHVDKKGEETDAEYFLFSDILLITTIKNEETNRCRYLDKISIRNGFVKEDGESFFVGNLGKSRKLHLICRNEKQRPKIIDAIKKGILRDTFDDWVADQKAAGKVVSITFTEWFNLYKGTLLG